jgi:hypothetical protein
MFAELRVEVVAQRRVLGWRKEAAYEPLFRNKKRVNLSLTIDRGNARGNVEGVGGLSPIPRPSRHTVVALAWLALTIFSIFINRESR